MSERELGRTEVLARVKRGELRVVDAAVLMGVCYRQAKHCGSAIGRQARRD